MLHLDQGIFLLLQKNATQTQPSQSVRAGPSTKGSKQVASGAKYKEAFTPKVVQTQGQYLSKQASSRDAPSAPSLPPLGTVLKGDWSEMRLSCICMRGSNSQGGTEM